MGSNKGALVTCNCCRPSHKTELLCASNNQQHSTQIRINDSPNSCGPSSELAASCCFLLALDGAKPAGCLVKGFNHEQLKTTSQSMKRHRGRHTGLGSTCWAPPYISAISLLFGKNYFQINRDGSQLEFRP